MNLRNLRFFVTVADKMNFTRAAEQLHTSQPALSVQIHKLEAELGVELFNREGRGVTLSAAGTLFLEHAKKILAEMDTSVALARLAAKGETGQLSIGYEGSAEFLVFPHVIPAFRKRWPNIHLKLQYMKSFKIFDGLRNDELDIGFALSPVPQFEFDIHPISEFSLVVAIPAAHPLTKKDTVTFADLSAEPLVMFAPSADPDLYRELNAHFTAAGATMNVVLETGHVLSGINFVSMGIGCCILGGYLRRVAWNGVVYKRLEAVGFMKTLAVVRARRSPRQVAVFFDFIRDCADGPDVRPQLQKRWDECDSVAVLPPAG
jgi:DNA-binding transcriptional LysR family regulator